MSDDIKTGIVVTLVADRGFAFVRGDGDTVDTFLHRRGFVGDFIALQRGDRVIYRTEEDLPRHPGRARAVDARRVDGTGVPPTESAATDEIE